MLTKELRTQIKDYLGEKYTDSQIIDTICISNTVSKDFVNQYIKEAKPLYFGYPLTNVFIPYESFGSELMLKTLKYYGMKYEIHKNGVELYYRNPIELIQLGYELKSVNNY
jgi:hypothetical protein